MLKKFMKKGTATVLAAAIMVGAFAGCGNGGSEGSDNQTEDVSVSEGDSVDNVSESDSVDSVSESISYVDYSAGFDEEVTISIPVYDRAFEGWNPTDNYYTRWVQSEFGDKYNIKVEYVAINRSGEVQDYMQMIAAGNAPDIIMHYDMPQAVNYYGEGAIQNLDLDEIVYYAPEYYSRLGETIATYGQLDGENAFFFAERSPIYYDEVELVRLDWLEQVSMELPTTLEERMEMGRAWKEAGLGTIGETLYVQSFTYEYPFISTTDEAELAAYLDLNVAPFTWKPTKEYLQSANTMYNEGILDQEYYLKKDTTDAKADFVSGKTGTYKFRIYNNTDVISTLLANNPEAKLAVLDPTSKSSDGTAHYYEYPSYGMIMGINSKTTDEQRAAIWMFLNWMIQDENLFYLQNGIEGETYTLDEDGVAVVIEGYDGEAKLSNNMNKDYWCLVQEVKDYGDEALNYKANLSTMAPAGYEYLVEQSYEYAQKNADQGIVTPIFTKSIESSSEYASDLNAMWQEFSVDCITSSPDEFESKYEAYCREYLGGGYQEILNEKNGYIESGDYISVK